VEELLNTDALHHNEGANAVLNILGVAAEVNAGLHESVGNNVDLFGVLGEESRLLGGSNALGVDGFRKLSLGDVIGEDILGTVEVLAELVVVDFSGGAEITVPASDQVKDGLGRRHEA
jgi:hypothetical protein